MEEGFDLLNILRASRNPSPLGVLQRLDYLWKTALELAKMSSIQLSFQMTKEFFDVALTNKVDLPEAVTSRCCSRCSVILLPAITCSVRVVDSKSKGSHGKNKVFKNKLIWTCLHCSQTKTLPGCQRVKKTQKLKKTLREPELVAPATKDPQYSTKRKFSFLQASRRHSEPPKPPVLVHAALVPSDSKAPASKPNLLELERENKKKRRKSGAASIDVTSAVSSPSPSVGTLSSMKSLFSFAKR